jgi:hypothetical protein
MKTINQAVLEKVLYIGDEIPPSLLNDTRQKFILLGTPQELIDEVGGGLKDKSEFEVACWIAEYAYKKANPNGKFSEPPSIVYEQVAKDFSNFLQAKSNKE